MTDFCDPGTIQPVETLDELIKQLRDIFEHDKVNVDYVKALMATYKSNPREWKKYAKCDPHRYTRNLVDEGNGKFNLMLLCWGEGQMSSIHSHANAHCFMKILEGTLTEHMYAWPTESDSTDEHQMVELQTNTYGRDEVTYICDEVGLHRVANPSHTDLACSLHLYSPPFDECDTFDERTGKRQKCKVTFWSKFGQRTQFRPATTNSSVSRKPSLI
ncbi:cysteine dioxygenase 1-like isoform X1 [Lineus longissimus]|uniref:cysteine dioxygenase 1-like isoform X1 n=1 Tax=Lineus longissimus TaxID=88925 RepID=UPI00315C8CDE